MDAMKDMLSKSQENSLLTQVIDLLNRITSNLEAAALQEQKFGIDVCMHFEHLSNETFKMSNNIDEIQKEYGG